MRRPGIGPRAWSTSSSNGAKPGGTSSGSSGSKSRSSSGFEIDEQRDANQDEHEWNEPAGDQRDLDERRRSVLAIFSNLFQACCLGPRMTDKASDFGLDDLAGLELVSRPIVLAHAAALTAAPASCAERNCPALSSAATASSRIG